MTDPQDTPVEFPVGSKVREKANPGTVGVCTGEIMKKPTHRLIKVKMPDGSFAWWREHLVELAPISVDRMSDFRAGRFGGGEDLQRCLMLTKIRGDLTDIFYSMNASDIDFFPHQFQPVLRFIESPTKRLLVADEVGLGKTIEAGLIWKELQARAQARRLLVVCPAMLREKWRKELAKRFGIQARISKAGDVLQEIAEGSADSNGFALVTGFEAIRPPKSPQPSPGPRQELVEHLEKSSDAEDSLFDLVIVDEAHYARNPETSTNRVVRLLNDCSAALVLLTATPIQLGSENLYELLRLVDPGRFNDPAVFRGLMLSNEPFVKAFSALNRTPPDRLSLVEALEEMEADSSSARFAQEVRLRLKDADNLSPDGRVALARLLERTSVISSVMTRSRKREVLQNRVERTPQNIKVTLSQQEKTVYESISRAILRRSASVSNADQISRLVLVTRQRQMASCMPAAINAWSSNLDLRELLFEDFGLLGEDEVDDDVLDPIQTPLLALPDGEPPSSGPDSKLRCLLKIIDGRLRENPNEKIVLFAYFRATLEYLKQRLEAAGHAAFLLHGGISDEKNHVVERFAEFQGPAVLLSSEVGSEGIDLQFCSTLINYDLPWNPMKVEQRIGRLDRLGQRAEKILIYNLVLTETIEDRILLRLHERIGVFKRSIGDLEQILGSDVQDLVATLFSGQLSDEERERRAEQNIAAIAHRATQLAELEDQASNLFAFTSTILREIDRSRELKRYLDPEALQRFFTSLLVRLSPGTVVQEEAVEGAGSTLRVELSPAAKNDLFEFINSHRLARTTRLCEPGRQTLVTTDPRWKGTLRIRPELVDASHPLILWLREKIQSDLDLAYPLSAVSVRIEKDITVSPGTYVYLVDRWQFDGLRKENRLVYAAIEVASDKPLGTIEAEKLVLSASDRGIDIPKGEPSVDLELAFRKLQQLSESMAISFDDEKSVFETENDSLLNRQASAVRMKAEAELLELQTRLSVIERATHDAGLQRTLPLIKGRIRAAKGRLEFQEARLEKARAVSGKFIEIAAGVIHAVS